MKKYLILSVGLFFWANYLFAQKNYTIDSLQQILKKTKIDTIKIKLLNEIALHNIYVNIFDAKKNAETALALAKKIKFEVGIAQTYITFAHIYYTQGNHKQSIENALDALRMFEKLGNQLGVANGYNILGITYIEQRNYTEAEKVLRQALDIYKNLDDKNKTAIALGNLGLIFAEQETYKTAQKYYLESLTIYRQNKDSIGISTMLNNLADCQMRQKNFSTALRYFEEAKAISQQINDQEGIIIINIGIGETYLMQNKLLEAEAFLLQAWQLAKKLQITSQEIYVLKTLSELATQKADFKQAFDYYQKYTTLKDSLQGKENLEKIAQMQTFYELEKREKENLALKQEQMDKNIIISNQRTVVIVFGVFLLLQLVFLILLYRANQFRKRVNQELSEKNEEISMFVEELRIKNDEIDRHREELADINQVKDKLFSIVAHDFRGPLNSLQGVLNLLTGGHLSENEVQYLLKGLADKVNDTQNLLENLLNWAKTQMQGIEINPEVFELNKIVNETVNVLKPIAEHKEVNIEIKPQPTIEVKADIDAIRLIIRNLISNAIKFTPNGGQVTIDAKVIDNQYVKVLISDNGVGIPTEKQNQLFDIKTHFTSYGTNHEKGTGLGLLLVKDFVQLNQGELGLESQENQGSTFYFTIPLAINSSGSF
jgi:two-component system, sensor histidine kinase and response regulator